MIDFEVVEEVICGEQGFRIDLMLGGEIVF